MGEHDLRAGPHDPPAQLPGVGLADNKGRLDAALEHVTRGRLASRDDDPARGQDPYVTALRRLPAVAAEFAPFPNMLDARVRETLLRRGITQLYTHQAE